MLIGDSHSEREESIHSAHTHTHINTQLQAPYAENLNSAFINSNVKKGQTRKGNNGTFDVVVVGRDKTDKQTHIYKSTPTHTRTHGLWHKA